MSQAIFTFFSNILHGDTFERFHLRTFKCSSLGSFEHFHALTFERFFSNILTGRTLEHFAMKIFYLLDFD